MRGLSKQQWLVFFAAWLGWGFDIFDGILFNFVAPNAIPSLLNLPLGSPEAKSATLYWTGIMTSVLLLGWAAGGILFGKITDRIGRTKTLALTMGIYSVGTALCAVAPNIETLLLFRLISSFGIGGEWAAGAALVAEVLPNNKRVEGGALLYTSAPFGLALAAAVNYLVAGVMFSDSPEVSWRYVLATGLLPAGVAFVLRLFVKEPEIWHSVEDKKSLGKISDLFSEKFRRQTLSGFLVVFVALVAWWSCNAFLPVIASGLAQIQGNIEGLTKEATQKLIESWKITASLIFNAGGLIGTLLTIPLAKIWGRRKMFFVYFFFSAISMFITFGLQLPPQWVIYSYFLMGLTVFGVFGSFTFYLPELFPTYIRGTGSGFCYNVGRIVAAAGPFLVGHIATQGPDSLTLAMNALLFVAIAPVIGILTLPWVIETKDQKIT